MLLVFLDPQSEAGAALLSVLASPVRLLTRAEADALSAGVDPLALMREGGEAWTRAVVQRLGGDPHPPCGPPSEAGQARRVQLGQHAPLPALVRHEAQATLPARARAGGRGDGRLLEGVTRLGLAPVAEVDACPVSRSEARRLLRSLGPCAEVVLDFTGVATLGQGLADEVFHVWAHQHPGTRLVVERANPSVAFVVGRARQSTPRALMSR